MVASMPRPHSEPCVLQYLATLHASSSVALPAAQHHSADATELTLAAPALQRSAPRRSISSFNPFALPVTDAALAALRPYRRISMSNKRRHQGARGPSASLQRDREAVQVPSHVEPPQLQRDSGLSTATRKSSSSRSGRDGPAELWDHVVAQSQSGLQDAHHAAASAGAAAGDPRSSRDDCASTHSPRAGRARSFMQAPAAGCGRSMTRLASEPDARTSNDSEHSAAAAALHRSAARHEPLRQLSAPDRASAVLALLHNSNALPSCSGSTSGTDTAGGSMTESDAEGALGPAAATPRACFASALYATSRQPRPSTAKSHATSAASSGPSTASKVGATSTDYSSASRPVSVPGSVFGSMSAVEMPAEAPSSSLDGSVAAAGAAPARSQVRVCICAGQACVGAVCHGSVASPDHVSVQSGEAEEEQARLQRERDDHFSRELDMRVGRARQTMDYAASQRCRFSRLQIATLTVWQALDLFNELRCA